MRTKGQYIKMNMAVVVIVFALLALTNCHTTAFAGDLPAGAVVQAGNASITSDGTNMTVATEAAKTWIDWTGGFNIGAANSVNNIAAETSAVILHRDITGALSNIQGTLTANCNVFLLNPSGILFGSGAQINVAGLLVSTLNMSIQDFINGDYLLEQGGADAGLITNLGEINATGPMGVTMAGGAVRNEGVINAGLGTVNLVSGSKVTLNADSEGLIQVAVDGKVLENVYDKDGNKVEFGVDNVGEINANGGKVYIETEAAQDVFSKLINQSGVVKAGSMINKGGKIVLVSNSEGIIQNTGILDAGAVESGAKGGTIEIRGEKVGQFGSVKADGLGAGDGGNVELRAAKTVALGPHSATTANAGVNGNGGRVVVFSPDSALMAPTARIAVRGGDNSGNGGFVEFSGQKYVEVNGIIDRSAPNGKAGLLLIDPTDITINDAGIDNTLWSADAWADDFSRAASQIDIDTLIMHLLAGNTTITTVSSGGAGNGDITLNAPGRILTNTTAHSLTLTAERNITLDTAVDFAGSGSLNLNASGAVAVNNSVALNGGAFDSNGTSFTSGALGTITTNGGAVDLSGHSAGITIGAAINTGGGSFTSAGTAFNNTGGTITTAGGDITINQSGAVIIGAALASGTGNVNIDAGNTLAINKPIISTNGNISIDSADATTIAAGGDIQTNSGTVTFGADKTGTLTTSADIIAGGSITFTRNVTLGAASVITSLNDSVTFTGDVSGAFSLTVNAAAGAVFSSTIGSNNDPTSLIITANRTRFGGAVSVGSLTVNGSGGTTTISADITSAGNVEINDNVVISGVRTISTAAANSDIYISGTINAATAGADSLTLAAGSGDVTLGNSVGNSVQLEDLTITSSGTTTLNHTIDVNGNASGEDINLSGATNVVLGSDVTLDSARSVYLHAINGEGHNLTVRAEYTIDLNAAISNVLNVSMTAVRGTMLLDQAVTAIQDATFTTINSGVDITVQAALKAGRSLTLTANTASTSSDIEIGQGSDFEAPVVTLRSCVIRIYRAVDNSIGSLHLIAEHSGGGTVLSFSNSYGITAHGDLTIDGSIWVDSDGAGLTSTDGDIRLNCTVDSINATSRDLSLTAGQGTVYAGTFGGTYRLEDISVSAQQLVLSGNITAETVNTSGVGLTTLANAIDIDTTAGAGSVTLGPLTGANNLTISAGGAVTLSDADIASLDIDSATTVSFNGDFVTSGGVTVDTAITGDITVASTGSIQAGGNITLDNTAGAGTADVILDGDVSAKGSGAVTINADDAVNIAQNAAASITAVNGAIDIDAAGAVLIGTASYAGKVVTEGSGNIFIDAGTNSDITITGSDSQVNAGGDVNIGQSVSSANVNVNTNSRIRAAGNITVDGDIITIQATGSVISTAGNIDLESTVGALNLGGNITAVGNTVTLTSAAGITDTTDGDTDITARTLSITAAGGIGSGAGTNALDTDVDYISASVSGTGDIYILEESGVTLTNITTANGLINITTGAVTTGDTVVTNVAASTTGAVNTVNITADRGDIYIGTVGAAGSTAAIGATAGSIYDDSVNTTRVTATSVSLTAAGSIGASSTDADVDTACTNLTAATTAGDIYITDDDAVTLTSITTGTGSIRIKGARSAAGDMTVTLVTAGTAGGSGDGDVTLETLDGGGSTNDIILAGPVTASSDSVTLISDFDISDSYATAADIVAGALYLQAGGSFGASGNYIDTNVSTIDDVASGKNVAGSIYISEYDDVELGSVNGLTTVSGDIKVEAGVSASGTLTAGSVTAGGSGDIYLTTYNTSDIALGYVNALGDDVTLISANNITDKDTDGDIDVVADHLYLQAAGYCGTTGTGAAIDTDVAYIDNVAGNVVAGSIYINENDGVTLGAANGLTSTNGPIYITAANNADGTLTASVVTVANDNSNGITLITNRGNGGLNNIQLGAVTAGTTSAVITLFSDNDILDGDGAVDITAYGLLLEAGGSVGTSGDYVDTAVSTIDDKSASANVHNSIYINESDGVNLGAVNGLSTDMGDIRVTAAGTLTASSVTVGDAGDVYLSTGSGDIAVGLITALDDDIYLNAAGSITDGDTGVDIYAGRLYLTAGAEVGATGDYIDTRVNNIDDYSVTENVAGNIYISEYDGVNLGALTSTGLSTDNGSVFVESNATEDGTLTATLVTAGGSGGISLKSQAGSVATGSVNDIAVGLLTASGDDVILNSNDDIIDLTYDEVTDIVASGLYLAAGGTVGGDGNGLELDTRVSTIDDISGSNVYESIYIIEYDGVSLGSVNGLTTDTGDIDITSAKAAAGDMDAVSVTAGGTGNILLTTLDGGSASNNINVGLVTAADDDVSLVSDGDITDADTTGLDVVAASLHLQSGGAVGAAANYLDTRVANIDDYSGGNVGTDLYISEYDGVILGALNTTTGLSTSDGEIKITAAVTAAGDLTAQKLTAGGTGKDIYLTTEDGGSGSNNIGLGVVTASGDDIYLNSDWDITDSDLDQTADLISSGLYLTAQGSFGGPGDPAIIEITVDTIDDYALGVNVAGNIYISETDTVLLGSIFGLTTDAGVIDIVIGDTATTGTLAANGGFGIFLVSTDGDLLDLGDGGFTATAKSGLRAGGIIGTIENPYNVNVTSGGLWVWAGSQNREVSVNLRGTVVSGTDTKRVEIFEPSPPGLVIFNNHLMGGGNYGSGSVNGSILSRGYGYINIIRNDLIDYVYAKALQQPWGYKLLLAWALEEGPKIDEKFMSDVPTTIDASLLNLPVLYTDMQKPMDYYVIRSIR